MVKTTINKLANDIEDTKMESTEIFENSNINDNFVRWYPHREVGNRPNITSDKAVKGKKASSDLEKYGSYHFEIVFFPEGTNTLLPKINITKINKENADNPYTKIVGGAGSKFIDVIYNSISESINQLKNSMMSTQYKQESSKGIVIGAPVVMFENQTGYKCDIYLPLNKYSTKRKSGIAEDKNITSDIGTGVLQFGSKMIGDFIGNAGNTVKGTTGGTFRDFIAPRITAPTLETLELQWDLIPRSQIEMEHILDILRFFQSASVPYFNKTDYFYNMPPVILMEAITYDFDNDENINLRPKRQYYITDINIDVSQDNGSVVLNPDGFPMFISLTVNLIKTDLTTYKELFKYPLM